MFPTVKPIRACVFPTVKPIKTCVFPTVKPIRTLCSPQLNLSGHVCSPQFLLFIFSSVFRVSSRWLLFFFVWLLRSPHVYLSLLFMGIFITSCVCLSDQNMFLSRLVSVYLTRIWYFTPDNWFSLHRYWKFKDEQTIKKKDKTTHNLKHL